MPVAKLSPMSQATISITPWMPKVNIPESNGSPVKLRMPSQVVQPDASDSTTPVVPSSASCQLENSVSSNVAQIRLASLVRSSKVRAHAKKMAVPMGLACSAMPSTMSLRSIPRAASQISWQTTWK